MRHRKNRLPAPTVLKPTTARVAPLLASIGAYVKLERLRLMAQPNHVALKGRLYLKAMQAASGELTGLQKSA